MNTGNFEWFFGVVENRHDPLKIGRVKVRALYYHTDNKINLPTADLPWAMVALPNTSPGISGLGQSPSFIVEGSWVYGLFRDKERQEMLVLGTLPGKPSELGNPNKGFYDPNRRSTNKDEADYDLSVYPRNANESDVNRLAVNEVGYVAESLASRRGARIENVSTADFNPVTAADGSSIEGSNSGVFSQPEIPYNAEYPYNHVFESEKGHILEFDDTADNERIHLRHKIGSSFEIDKDGNWVTLTKGSAYTFTDGSSSHYIQGNSDTTINGHHKLYINKDGNANNHYDIQIGPNANINIQVDKGNINVVTVDGNINVNSGGDYNLKVQGNYTETIEGNRTAVIEGSNTENTTGAKTIRGATIDLNP